MVREIDFGLRISVYLIPTIRGFRKTAIRKAKSIEGAAHAFVAILFGASAEYATAGDCAAFRIVQRFRWKTGRFVP
jgi:hypothetical protein